MLRPDHFLADVPYAGRFFATISMTLPFFSFSRFFRPNYPRLGNHLRKTQTFKDTHKLVGPPNKQKINAVVNVVAIVSRRFRLQEVDCFDKVVCSERGDSSFDSGLSELDALTIPLPQLCPSVLLFDSVYKV